MILDNLKNYKGQKENTIDSAYLRVKENKYRRKVILRNRIIDMMLTSPYQYFITLTIKRNKNYNEKYIKDKAIEYLTSLDIRDYICNIDYSPKTNRQHIHCVVGYYSFAPSSWLYGTVNFQKIRINKASTEKISQYLMKLVNHADKQSATTIFKKRFYKNKSLIYFTRYLSYQKNYQIIFDGLINK